MEIQEIKDKIKNNKKFYIDCACSLDEHVMRVEVFVEDNDRFTPGGIETYISLQIPYKKWNLWRRVKFAFDVIFGTHDTEWGWDSTLLTTEQLTELKNIILAIEEINEEQKSPS